MRNIIHKYEVGDQVMFKVSFKNPTCGLADKGGTVATIAGIAPSYDNKPHYYLEGEEAIYPESVFSGRYEAPADPEEEFTFTIETLNDNGSGMCYGTKEEFLQEVSRMIDDCIANGGTFFDIQVDSDASCFYTDEEA